MRLLISPSLEYHSARAENRLFLDVALVDYFCLLGFDPVIFPVLMNYQPGYVQRYIERMDIGGIVLSGGASIGDNPVRDLFELDMLDISIRNDIPTLGLCRGMQVMLHHGGGALRHIDGHVGVSHQLSGEISGTVNSFHTLSVVALPENYLTLAKSPDGCIEAIGHTQRRWEGWMWHPERPGNALVEESSRIRRLFSMTSGIT